MTYKQQIIALATEKFTQFGSKQFTMDELAAILSVSKKTIYKHFSSKEDLVSESVRFLIEKIKKDVDETLTTKTNPILKIVAIYQIGFEYFKCFGPSFEIGRAHV